MAQGQGIVCKQIVYPSVISQPDNLFKNLSFVLTALIRFKLRELNLKMTFRTRLTLSISYKLMC